MINMLTDTTEIQNYEEITDTLEKLSTLPPLEKKSGNTNNESSLCQLQHMQINHYKNDYIISIDR